MPLSTRSVPFAGKIENTRTRRLVVFGGGAFVLLAIAIVAIVAQAYLRNDTVALQTDAPLIPTPAGGSKISAGRTSGTLHFVIGDGSKAQYVASEHLSFMPVTTQAVGETSDVTGDLYLTKDGLVSGQKSTIKVDLRTLRSDESLRDRLIVRTTMNAVQFPYAEFVIESVTGFPTDYSENKQVQLTINGTMTMHETSKPVTWTAYARRAGDYLTAIADTDVKLTDFGMTPPVQAITRVEDPIHLQITIFAKLASN